jgi:hypothetical protein
MRRDGAGESCPLADDIPIIPDGLITAIKLAIKLTATRFICESPCVIKVLPIPVQFLFGPD